jgi:CRISPR-associated protein Cas2
MFVVVAYDIVDDKIRRHLVKVLKNYGRRVQKSVFECRIDDRQYLKMRREIEKLIDFEADSVRYYLLCQRCVGNIEFAGWGAVQEDEDVIIV